MSIDLIIQTPALQYWISSVSSSTSWIDIDIPYYILNIKLSAPLRAYLRAPLRFIR
ncbi:MAG: hypothetical protein ACRAVC_18480 [Trichormus sp.]